MIGGDCKPAGGDRQSSLLVRFSRYRPPVGVMSGLILFRILFRLVAFGGRSAMGWSVPSSLGEFSVERPPADWRGIVHTPRAPQLRLITAFIIRNIYFNAPLRAILVRRDAMAVISNVWGSFIAATKCRGTFRNSSTAFSSAPQINYQTPEWYKDVYTRPSYQADMLRT